MSADLGLVIFFTVLQASLSVLGAILIGFIGAIGLLSLNEGKKLYVSEMLLLLPGWLPGVLLLFSVITLVELVTVFPFGLSGVVLVHSLFASGFVAVALAKYIRQQFGGQIELVSLLGVKPIVFFSRVLWPQLRPAVGQLAAVLFFFFITSYNIALIAGGPRATTLEVLMHQSLKDPSLSLRPSFILLIEVALLAALGFMGWYQLPVSSKATTRNCQFVAWRPGLWLCLLLNLVLFLGTQNFFWQGFKQNEKIPHLSTRIVELTGGSLIMAFATGFFTWVLLEMILFLQPARLAAKFFSWYLFPSAALLALAFAPLPPQVGYAVIWKVALAIALFSVPLLFKWQVLQQYQGLRQQIVIGRSLGASWFYVYRRIVRPQMAPVIGASAGLATLWASGDYVMTNIIAHESLTLAQLMTEFMTAYRLELAAWLVWPLLLVGGLAYAFFWGIGHVAGRKSYS